MRQRDIFFTIFGIIIGANLMILIGYLMTEQKQQPNQQVHVCKEDSLQTLVNDLQIELEVAEEGWGKKEQRYEDILFEYEYGLNSLKDKHPEAFKEFHRIIALQTENYSPSVRKENEKRLKWK
jgi:hypothetical protein